MKEVRQSLPKVKVVERHRRVGSSRNEHVVLAISVSQMVDGFVKLDVGRKNNCRAVPVSMDDHLVRKRLNAESDVH